jgi:hypothetical protein
MPDIRQKLRNIFCPPENFQINQNFPNLAEKTAILQRCSAAPAAAADETQCTLGPSSFILCHRPSEGSWQADSPNDNFYLLPPNSHFLLPSALPV